VLLSLVSTAAMAQQAYRATRPENPYYLQCAARMAIADNNPGYQSPQGMVGIFKFDVYTAQRAGLCSNPVPRMRNIQLWKLCDFNGPIAQKYNIRTLFDFRFDPNARAAQFEMMRNLTPIYDGYLYSKKYDLFYGQSINGVTITPEILRALLHTHGRAAVDAYMQKYSVKNFSGYSLHAPASCMEQCMAREGKEWFCN